MTINRSTFSSILPAAKQPSIAKVIKTGITPTGYTRVVTVRTSLVAGKPVEVFQDIMVHPDRATGLDIKQFDAISIDGASERNVVDPRANTVYLWAKGLKAVGRHLVELVPTDEIDALTGEPVCQRVLAGVGIYGATPTSDTNGTQE